MTSKQTSTLTVVDVEPVKGEVIEMSDGTSYTRYSSDNWREWIGESTETVFSCEHLELAYQNWRFQNAK